MLVVSRFTVPVAGGARFAELAHDALAALAARPGFRRGHAGRSVDDPAEWVLVSEWDGVGAYRRALGTYEVKLAATPLLAQARDEAGAFEELITADGAGVSATALSDRAVDADSAGPGGIRGTGGHVRPADEHRDDARLLGDR
ncbi:MAG TPA: antibiotic biosynthesis monooxygenase [Mycobacteriales bacterium]|nr:antibiotic biosynthesis monooxygenase [Mycobacteriales bacterium]